MAKSNSSPAFKTIYLYTDGACSGNPGPGGYAFILKYGGHEKEYSEGFKKTTNNRMELMAVIKGLEELKFKGSCVQVITDSKYVTEAVNKQWLFGWEKKHWKKVKNPDLWKRLLELFRNHEVTFEWVKGHAGHPMNERCDYLAVQAYTHFAFSEDEGYDKSLHKELF